MRKNHSKILIKFLLSTTLLSGAAFSLLDNQQNQIVQASAWSGTQTSTAGSYYDAISESATGTTLSSSLNTLVNSGSVSVSYDWSRYEAADEAEGYSSMVLQIYARTNIAKTAHVSGSLGWNREHTYPQSKLNNSTAEADNHLIFADDNKTNSIRGNKSFAEVSEISANQVVDSTGRITENYSNSTYFEPLDAAKGEVARATFYTNIKYGHAVTGNFDTLETALRWHIEHPVTNREIYRNNTVHTLQKNRNPFIDKPEYACRIWGATNSATQQLCSASQPVAPTSLTMSQSSGSINVGETLDLDVTANSGASNDVTWTSSNNSIATVSSLGVVTGVASGSVTITATSTLNSGVTATATVTVTANVLESISIQTLPTQTVFPLGSTFNSNGLIIQTNYTSSTSTISSGFTLSIVDMMKLGQQTVIVTYQGKQTSYAINVTNANAQVQSSSSLYASELFISEYIEGSSSNKAIEIYNGTGTTIDLSGYSIALYSNGSSEVSSFIDLTGTLAHNDVYVIANSSANSSIQAVKDVVSTVTYFDGNDALALKKSSTIIDIMGIIGESIYWTSGSKGMGEQTLVRKASVASPSTTFSFDEWDSYPQNTTSYLGTHTMEGGISSGITLLEQSSAYATYFLDITDEYCTVLNGISIPWENLSSEYGFMANDSKDFFIDNSDSPTISAAKARYYYLIHKYTNLRDDNFLVSSGGNPLYTFASPEGNNVSEQENTLGSILLITIFSITSLAGYYFISKKKRS